MMLVTHRGPYRFSAQDDGSFESTRGAGGIVSALLPLVTGRDRAVAGERQAWVAAAIDADDRAAVAAGAATVPGLDLHLLDLDPARHRMHYDVISNAVLWFLHHGLFDLARRPRFDQHLREAWDGYVAVNATFADAIAERATEHEQVLVHDYHLALVPGMVLATRPDLRVTHFTHTPFCGPNSIRVLPTDMARAICTSMASVPAGFHTERWARAYVASTREMLGPDHRVEPPYATPLGPDPEALAKLAVSPATTRAAAELDELVGDRKLVFRSDRIDLSKNIVRGFHVFDHLLASRPEWRGGVVFVAMLNRSRENLAEYLAYEQEVDQAAARVNERWGTPGWQPVVVDTRDDYEQTIAGFTRYDALVVNPVKDGLNLVAKEGPLVNRRDGVVVLSPEAGAYDELADAVLPVHPYDIEQGADALHTALAMPDAERHSRAMHLRALAAEHTPQTWLAELLNHAR
ncbi:MAG: trehalose 6-phosphate synthase [Actinomycetota bacterium]|nr:trehalose 6-phosphate synthase [Actinomycetota bacterium]